MANVLILLFLGVKENIRKFTSKRSLIMKTLFFKFSGVNNANISAVAFLSIVL